MYSVSEGKAGRCLRATAFIARGTRLFTFDPRRWQKEKTYQVPWIRQRGPLDTP